MTKPMIQIGDVVREMTDEENAQWLLDATEIQAQTKAAAAKETARAAALAKLGLTADEVAALFG